MQYPSMQIPPRLPLVIDPLNRDDTTNKDARLVNAYVEYAQGTEPWIFKRPGLLKQAVVNSNEAGMGLFTWNNNVYSLWGDGTIYKNGVKVVTGTLDTSNGKYSFSSLVGSTPKMSLQNGIQGYSYDDIAGLSATLHSINTSYPANTTKGIVYLDGTTYVLQNLFGTQVTPATIWGSNINSIDQAGDWSAINFITAQIEPDPGIFLAKQLIYVVCLKQWTTEVFVDAGNATGSPLAPVENFEQPYGCAHQDSVQNIESTLFWMSNNRTASRQIVMMRGLQISVVSTPAIDRLLQNADLTTVYSLQVKINGHSFYILTIKNNNITLVYDISQNRWSQWTDANGNYWPYIDSTFDSNGNHILQHESNGSLYYLDSTYYTDDGEQIPVTIITPAFDAGTRRKKIVNQLEFITDQVSGSALTVQYSDDDYQTWSNPRLVNLGGTRAIIHNFGSFRRRGWKFIHAKNAPFRIQGVEIQMDIGVL